MTDWYKSGVLDYYQFGIMTSPGADFPSYITIGGFDENGYDSKDKMVGHTISGSFHWSIHLVKFWVNGKEYLT